MDHQRFDRLSRSLAARTTRRQAVRTVGAGSVLGGIGAVLGTQALQAQAPVQTCTLPFYAEVYLGPWLGTVYQGTLTLDIAEDGAIDSGWLDTIDGQRYPLVGHTAGRGLDARIDLGNGLLLTLTGTAELAFTVCQGAAAGSFAGPEMGNMGTWTTTGAPPGPPSATQTPNPCAAVSCFAPQTPNPVTCACECPAPFVTCGGSCCPDGWECLDAEAGVCSCPEGTEPCGDACVPACTDGEGLDLTSCECAVLCPGVECALNEFLNEETCLCEELPECVGGTACGPLCVDLASDPNNCGACGYECPYTLAADSSLIQSLCVEGACCLGSDMLCAADGDCCSRTCNFTADPGVRVCA